MGISNDVCYQDEYVTPDAFQLSLALPPTSAEGIEALYVDQAPSLGYVSFYYTPYGIREIDSDFGRRIRSCTVENAKGIREDILLNPHLHAYIKENLLQNLDNYEKAAKEFKEEVDE